MGEAVGGLVVIGAVIVGAAGAGVGGGGVSRGDIAVAGWASPPIVSCGIWTPEDQ